MDVDTLSSPPINNYMKLIFGHMCNHAFIDPFDLDYWDTAHDKTITRDDLCFATCDFTNPSCYETVCEEFGFELKTVEYEPYTGLSPEDNWRIQPSLKWSEVWSPLVEESVRLDPDNYYFKTLYTPVRSIISLSDWYSTLAS